MIGDVYSPHNHHSHCLNDHDQRVLSGKKFKTATETEQVNHCFVCNHHPHPQIIIVNNIIFAKDMNMSLMMMITV